MLYMIDKNMKICRDLKLLENSDDQDNIDDEEKKNDDYDLTNYISDNEFDVALNLDSVDAHDISDQLCHACLASHQLLSHFFALNNSKQSICKCQHQDKTQQKSNPDAT
jgi:hypothetical protein